MKTTDLELQITYLGYAEFGQHCMDKLLVCLQNLIREHLSVQPALFT